MAELPSREPDSAGDTFYKYPVTQESTKSHPFHAEPTFMRAQNNAQFIWASTRKVL